jgi:5-methylcytosine-specific restriction endonuclease McrA
MIPVQPQPEPPVFNELVRVPGKQFLAEVPTPTTKQWEGKEYWRRALPDMRKAYKSICTYCAHWIPHSTGNHSIDHFVPRFREPNLAYEWSNFRYVAARFNSRKGTRAILDPFNLLPNWFIIDFTSLFVKPNPDLLLSQKEAVLETIKHLKLNEDDDLVAEREAWIQNYRDGHISFSFLKKQAPFIAYELERQGLLN